MRPLSTNNKIKRALSNHFDMHPDSFEIKDFDSKTKMINLKDVFCVSGRDIQEIALACDVPFSSLNISSPERYISVSYKVK